MIGEGTLDVEYEVCIKSLDCSSLSSEVFHIQTLLQTFPLSPYITVTMNGHANGHLQEATSAGRRLRQMLADPSKTVVAPGVYDGITARMALASGAECLYMVRRLELFYLINPLMAFRPAPAPACLASAWQT